VAVFQFILQRLPGSISESPRLKRKLEQLTITHGRVVRGKFGLLVFEIVGSHLEEMILGIQLKQWRYAKPRLFINRRPASFHLRAVRWTVWD